MLKRGFRALPAEANAVVETASAGGLLFCLEDAGAVLVDVRETEERDREGSIPGSILGSIHASRGLLEFQADPDSPVYNKELRPDAQIIHYCGTGGRSTVAANTLLDMGFEDVSSLAGGYAAWRAARDK
jgi:rhodanese-related sulfurtransferase